MTPSGTWNISPPAELNRRAADLISNILTLTPQGQIGCLQIEGGGTEWMRKVTHVFEEFQLRFGPYPGGFSKETLEALQAPKPTFPDVPPGWRALSAAGLEKGRCLLKFGKRSHMEAMVGAGTIRIAPASVYKDPSLNAAVHDDELSFERIAPPGAGLNVSRTPGGPFAPVGGIFDLRVQETIPTDYLVYCLTHAADHRLFDDFEADACVAITNPKEFLQRLTSAVKTALPEWSPGAGRVRYVDPHGDLTGELWIPLTKHFRYSYQSELRIASAEEHCTQGGFGGQSPTSHFNQIRWG
jgi:hypothetical protein